MNKQSKTILGIVLLLGIALMIPMVKAVETPSVHFSNVAYERNNGWILGGKVDFNNAPAEQLRVKIFCDGKETANDLTDLNGNFHIASRCASGQDSYAQVEYNKGVVQCAHLDVPYTGRSHKITNPDPTEGQENPAEIPEFGVIAGAVALVGALGIFAFRRK